MNNLSHAIMSRAVLFAFIVIGLLAASPVSAQDLRQELDAVFVDILESALTTSPGQHAEHYLPERVENSQRTLLAVGNFIGTNVSSFPLSSSATGLTFDFSTGVPVPTTSSAGPVFAERARTLGSQKLNVGANVSVLNFKNLRGLAMEDVSVTLFHQDVAAPGLGDRAFEYDYIDLNLGLDLSAVVFASYATYGLTDRIDVGVAIPVVSVSMKGAPVAQMNSFTYASTGSADHFFDDGSGTWTSENPLLTYSPPEIDATSTGLGDIALRAKGHFLQSPDGDLAGLVEVRLPTGNEDNFHGTGNTSVKLGLIGSASWSGFNPHVNLAYDIRTGDIERNRLGITLGYDQKIGDALTLAAEWIGNYELGSAAWEMSFPEPVTIKPADASYPAYEVRSTTIPNYSADHIINTAFGIKYTPQPNLLLVANVIFPVNNGGLRSSFIPTVGIEFNL
jgi:hypothetical protein